VYLLIFLFYIFHATAELNRASHTLHCIVAVTVITFSFVEVFFPVSKLLWCCEPKVEHMNWIFNWTWIFTHGNITESLKMTRSLSQ